jgi:hypothetical protein
LILQSEWIDLLVEYWQYAAGALMVLAIIMMLFPWGKLIDWIAQSAWRTVMLFVGVLPLDDGLNSISDNEVLTLPILAFTPHARDPTRKKKKEVG